MEWRLLLRAMQTMGFSNDVWDLIYRNIRGITYRVCINGFYSDKFRSSRGVRQGDPLSPLLFIITQQIFSFNLNCKHEMFEIWPYKHGRAVSHISHYFCVDDMLLFTNGRIRSLRRLENLMYSYETPSGQ